MEAVWAALQDSSFAALVRNSTFIYPIANVTHVVAVIAFFGVVAAMDLRLLHVFEGVPARVLIARLRPVALILLFITATAGFILFSAEAVALARNAAFRVKFAAIAVALVNIAINDCKVRVYGADNTAVRFTAGVSLLAWLVIAAMGRWIADV